MPKKKKVTLPKLYYVPILNFDCRKKTWFVILRFVFRVLIFLFLEFLKHFSLITQNIDASGFLRTGTPFY